jgi:hypothetical protein
MLGMPEWGAGATRARTTAGSNWWIAYRHLCNGSMTGAVLAAHLMSLTDEWNWPATFDYYDDRWWPDRKDHYGTNLEGKITPFVGEMWKLYRGDDQSTERVGAPLIEPGGGLPRVDRLVTMSSDTPGAAIHYTIDGSDPTRNSPLYEDPITAPSGFQIKAFAVKDGLGDSEVRQTSFSTSFYSNAAWQNVEIGEKTGRFVFQFDMVPSANFIDGVCGLGSNIASWYTDLAVIVRFSPAGRIDARNGSGYSYANDLPYEAGRSYRVEMDIDINSHKYSVWVTPDQGARTLIADNYWFRTDQLSVSDLNYFTMVTSGGAHEVHFKVPEPPDQLLGD